MDIWGFLVTRDLTSMLSSFSVEGFPSFGYWMLTEPVFWNLSMTDLNTFFLGSFLGCFSMPLSLVYKKYFRVILRFWGVQNCHWLWNFFLEGKINFDHYPTLSFSSSQGQFWTPQTKTFLLIPAEKVFLTWQPSKKVIGKKSKFIIL